MRRSPLIGLLMFALTASAAPPLRAPRQAADAAQTPAGKKGLALVRTALAAMGGELYLQARYRTASGRAYDFSSTGELASTGTPYWIFTRFPDAERVELGKKRDVIEIVNGERGWEVTYKGVAPMLATQLNETLALRSRSLDVVLKTWAADPSTLVLYQGLDQVDQTQADAVAFYYKNPDPVTIDFDTSTHLPVRLEWRRDDPLTGGHFVESIVYGNWNSIGGIETPMDTSRFEGPRKIAQQYLNSVDYAPLSDSLFEPAPLKKK